jgi:hypothetical protein
MNTIFGPFTPPEPPVGRHPVSVEIRGGIPQIAWQDPQNQTPPTYTELYLPPGWFYAFRTNDGEVERLEIWNTKDIVQSVEKRGDSLVIHFPVFGKIELRLDGHLAMRTQTGTLNASDVVPSGLLLVDATSQALPQTCCKAEWLGALNLSMCKVTRVGQTVKCSLGFANGGELQHTANLKLQSLTSSDSSRVPTLWVWPRQIQQGWQVYRCLADLMVRNVDTTSVKRLRAIPYACVQSATASWLVRCEQLDGIKPSELIGGVSLQARSGFLLPSNQPPGVQITALYWHIEATIEADVFVGLHAAGTQRVPEVAADQSPAGQARIAMDLGTSTTVLAYQVVTTQGQPEAGVFKIDALDSFWEPASIAPVLRHQNGFIPLYDGAPWLPWLRRMPSETKDPLVIEQFPSRLLLQKVAPSSSGDSAAGQFCAALVNRAGKAMELPGSDAHMEAGVDWYLTAPGSLKWNSHQNNLVGLCREIFIEQLLLFCVSYLRHKQPGLHAVKLIVSAPAAFDGQHRASYSRSLTKVIEQMKKWTGMKVDLEITPQNEVYFHDESRPVLQSAISSVALGNPAIDARDGSVRLPVVVVADLGGETFDFGVYVCVAQGNYLELYNHSYRAAGYGVLKRVAMDYMVGKWWETSRVALDDTIRNEGLGFLRHDNPLFLQNKQLDARNELIGLIVSLLLSLRATVAAVKPDLEEIINDLRNQTPATDYWHPGDQNPNLTWSTSAAALLGMLNAAGQQALAETARTPSAVAVATPASASPVLVNVLESLRKKVAAVKEAGGSAVDLVALAKWLDDLDCATPEPARLAPTTAAPAVVQNAPSSSNTVSLDVKFYLAGNGWRLYDAAPEGEPNLSELMKKTMKRLNIPVSVRVGNKSDCAAGLMRNQGQAVVIWRHVRNGRPVNRAPHGARLNDPQASLPLVYTETRSDQMSYQDTIAPKVAELQGDEYLLDREGFDDMKDLFTELFSRKPTDWLQNLLRVLNSKATWQELDKQRQDDGLKGPLMKTVLEAVYRS